MICRHRLICTTTVAALLAGCGGDRTDTASEPDQRPNVLVIMADDLGYTDLGSYGGEIRTPNIDRLAAEGLRFRQFYVAATCSPTRAMFLTGVDHHLAGLGSMAEHVAPNQRGRAGYEGFLNERVVTLPTLLRRGGYRTYMAGKWHLGTQPGSRPHERGFDRSFALLQAGASHFSDQARMVSIYPETIYLEDGERVVTLPGDFYSSEAYASKLIEYLRDDASDDRPFFAWLAFTAPHWPLQVPDAYRDLYAGMYDEGYDETRARRLAGARRAGIVEGDADGSRETPRVPTAQAWSDLPRDEQRYQSRSMEIYAAMIERMDVHVGRVLGYLEEEDLLRNTIVVFLSDNGAEGNDRMQAYDNRTWVPANFDLSYENIGRRNSYAMTLAGWGQVSSVPLRYYKQHLTEGGLRAPLIISGPSVSGAGSVTDAVMTVRDLAPTILEMADVDTADATFEVHAMSGRSLLPVLRGESEHIYTQTDGLGWELFGQRALRKGDWKILSSGRANGDDGWRLYNVAHDPGELEDLSARFPERVQELSEAWQSYAEANNVIPPRWD